MGTAGRVFRDLKKFRDRVTHEVPTGPHTDVKKRKINPSFKKKLETYPTDPREQKKRKEIKVSNKQPDLKEHKKAVDPSQMRQQRKQQQKQSLRQYQKQNLTKDYAYTGIPGAKATAKGVTYKKYNIGGRTNLLEELGRVEAEPSNRNRRAEVSRVHRELNRGYKSGGAVLKGKKVGCQIK